jgi:hypothetical protein
MQLLRFRFDMTRRDYLHPRLESKWSKSDERKALEGQEKSQIKR